MEDQIVKKSEAMYFKSATVVLKGDLIMTDKRISYSGVQDRMQMNHGAVGNIVRDKIEEKMGYNDLPNETIFDLPLIEVTPSLKRFGFSKRLVITDIEGNDYKLTIDKKERDSWLDAIEKGRR
ncbi:MAG: hypothetical protein P8Q14_09590 [Vicingaceae bacterium]|nr:hypothetical protein [Vicingaceae bacterium]